MELDMRAIEEAAADPSHPQLVEDILKNPDDYGIAPGDADAASTLATLLILEKHGLIVREDGKLCGDTRWRRTPTV